MPGVTRRNKPLKAKTTLADAEDLSIVNPAAGDLLIYDAVDGLWENGKGLVGSYTLSGSLSLDDLTVANDLTIANDLTVAGQLSAAVAQVTSLAASAASLGGLTVSGNAALGGTLAIAGLLTGAGFSFSGAGAVAGALVVGGSLDADTLAANTADIAGALQAGTVQAGGVYAALGSFTNASVSGAVAAGQLGAAGNVEAGGSLIGDELLLANAAVRSYYDFGADSAFLEVQREAGQFALGGTQTGGAPALLATFDPDGASTLFHDGTAMLRTVLNGAEFWDGSAWQSIGGGLPPGSANYYPYTWNAPLAQWEPRTPQVWFNLDEDLDFMLDDDDNVILDEPPAYA